MLRQNCNGKAVSSVPSFVNGEKNRQHDFVQGMVIKIRFTKRLTVDDLDKSLFPDGKVLFSSCDKIQIKLAQLELNSIRLVANSKSIGIVL